MSLIFRWLLPGGVENSQHLQPFSYPTLSRVILPYSKRVLFSATHVHNIGATILWTVSILILPVGVNRKTKTEEGCCNELIEFNSTKENRL